MLWGNALNNFSEPSFKVLDFQFRDEASPLSEIQPIKYDRLKIYQISREMMLFVGIRNENTTVFLVLSKIACRLIV